MPRGLASRIWLAVAVVALATLLVAGGGLFVALRDAHRDATKATLTTVVTPLQVQVRGMSGSSTAAQILAELEQSAEARYTVHLLTGSRVLGPEDSRPPDAIRDEIPQLARARSGDYVTADGSRRLFAGTHIGRSPAGPIRLVLSVEDRSGVLAMADVVRTLPAVIIVTVIVGGLLAWLLARSVRDPLRRLAAATADVPSARATPVPIGGPAEVRELAGRFNAMLGELRASRSRENELLANLRHDLRTPVTVIAGYAQALADGTAAGPAAAQAAEAIEQESRRLEALVDELGAVERFAGGSATLRPETLDAAAVVTSTRDRFLPTAMGRGVDLAVVDASDGADLSFAGDRMAVERMVGNLVANALGVVGGGGHVWLEARPHRMDDGRPAVAMLVTDDGPGFPPGTLERVFERFYRGDTARAGKGSGLGLAIVRELAEAHGGRALAENVAPRGARVSLILPSVPVPLTGS